LKLIIAEYLRTLKERDELDRLLPDLLLEMNYVLVARPQTGNRQYGVDIAARGVNEEGKNELLLLVVKQGDIGRREWERTDQAVRQSINEIFDVYLRSHIEPDDVRRSIRILVVTNGELKQTIQASWSGFVSDNEDKAKIEFWGTDKIASLVDKHLLDEHIFVDQDRHDLRRALALAGDAEYDRADFYRMLLRQLDLNEQGELRENPRTGKHLIKSVKIAHLAARIYSGWSLGEQSDARQGLYALERTMLWVWHRLMLSSDVDREKLLNEAYGSIWTSYLEFVVQYVNRLQPHFYTQNSLSRSFASSGLEASLIAFEQVGILSTTLLTYLLLPTSSEQERAIFIKNASRIADALLNWMDNNGATSSPCLDKHSQNITLAMLALLSSSKLEEANGWLKKLSRNVDYAYKAKRYVPISTDALDDLVNEGGWEQDLATDRMMRMSWMLPTIAGWSVITGNEDVYKMIMNSSREDYPNICMQLWHPEKDLYSALYFKRALFESGITQAPINLPDDMNDYRQQMNDILEADFGKVIPDSPAVKRGLMPIDIIAYRHFGTPIPPALWYNFLQPDKFVEPRGFSSRLSSV
jgi:hypothetical protein